MLFAVPGAFTPTCSEKHLPGFVEHFDEFRKKGIEVACVSVNDPFVMQAWGQSQHVPDELMMLADGNGEFTRALGLEMDASAYGMGTRSKRYAILPRTAWSSRSLSRPRANSASLPPNTCSRNSPDPPQDIAPMSKADKKARQERSPLPNHGPGRTPDGADASRRCRRMTDVQTLRDRARKSIDDGAVTDSYTADRKAVVRLLNEALATEWVCVLRYYRHYFMASGMLADSVKAEFLEHAQQELAHANLHRRTHRAARRRTRPQPRHADRTRARRIQAGP